MNQDTRQPGQTGTQQPYQPGQPHPAGQQNVQRPTGATTVTPAKPADNLTDEQRKAKEKEDAHRREIEERARQGK
jgi:hypothetical protein